MNTRSKTKDKNRGGPMCGSEDWNPAQPSGSEARAPPRHIGGALPNPAGSPCAVDHSFRSAPATTIKSTESLQARKLAAEAEHARKVADIAARQLALEQTAADLSLRAELAAIEAEGSNRGGSHNNQEKDVQQWLNDVQPLSRDDVPAPTRTKRRTPEQYHRGPEPHTHYTVPATYMPPSNMPANFQVPKSDIKLPIFDGKSPTEWLSFKRIYLDTQAAYSTVENLSRISTSLRGAAREAVYILLVAASNPMEVIDALEMRFGRPERIVLQEINAVRALPRVSAEGKDLAIFACRVKNCVGIMKLLDQPHYLYSPEIFNCLVGKLSPIVRAKWYDFAEHLSADQHTTKLEALSNFLTREVELQTKFGVIYDSLAPSASTQPTIDKNIRSHYNATEERPAAASNLGKPVKKCVFCTKNHDVNKCENFLTLSVPDRWQWVKKNKVCHRCLGNRPHRFNLCKVMLPCSVGGCTYKHHALLHDLNPNQNMLAHADLEVDLENSSSDSEREDTRPTLRTADEPDDCETEQAAHASAAANAPKTAGVGKSPNRPLLKVVAVQVTGPLGTVDTYALLDDGCTATFIDSEISKSVGVGGPSKQVRIDCVGGLTRNCDVQYVDFKIKGQNCTNTYQVRGARSIDSLGVNYRAAIEREDICKYTYLSDLGDVLCCEEAQPMLIIGVDNWQLTIASDTRAGKKHEPVAIRTALGWVLYGFISSKTKRVDFLHHVGISDDYEDNLSLESTIKDYYKLDSVGIEKRDHRGTSDTHALKILQNTVRRLPDGHFEAGLLWRPDIHTTPVPNSFKLALSRFLSLENKMKANNEYAELYRKNVHAMFEKKYAEECVAPPVGISWYLPHFGVTHPHKPGKLRVVHDAAAKYEGVSLNSLLVPGPDLLQPLLAILVRFRENAVALTADIREMFPQVRIRPADRDAQRFLWRDHPTDELKTYRMSSMMFGACSSPCTALYVKNLNANELAHECPNAARATVTNVYMDDYIGSLRCVDEAARLALDIVELNRKAGYEMRDWISNRPEALSLVPPELISQKQTNVNLGRDDEASRVLGLTWKPHRDVIGFSYKSDEPPNGLTKREALSHLMSVYDPLGILGPIVSRGRIMFQFIWRQGLAWDHKLSQSHLKLWAEWFRDLKLSSELQLPRAYCLNVSQIVHRGLHLFCDASELAYAAVAYWRFVFDDGTVKLALIGSKSRVAPLKPASIPRLELQAALIAARFASFIRESHHLKPTSVTFWSDSLNVLGWLRSDARSFKPFVAHRIGEILEITDVEEWRWVPTAENVADDATRLKRIVLTQESRWVVGPRFLLLTEKDWPPLPLLDKASSAVDIEIKPNPHHCHLLSLNSLPTPLVVDPVRLSSWLRLLRATATAHKFLKLLKREETSNVITAEDLDVAEIHLLRHSQLTSFPETIISLSNQRPIPRGDRLFKLTPFLDKNYLLRLKGRIDQAAGVNENAKNPVILDPRHPTVQLLITHYHRKMAHGNGETIVNEIRQTYWIINLRSAVRTITRNCRLCCLRRAKPMDPPRGDLPAARLSHHKRPFTFVGVDYFGPLVVAVGRRQEKRYVALYTCLVVRAVHLEVVYSLSTDAAIMSLRRFIARRGTPSEIWSDNGTAFVGASRVLRELYGEAVATFATNEKISWRFMPPSAPFMGGAWERLVGSIKTAIKITMTTRSPSDEVLNTFLLEAESLVNSRPLTHVPAQPDCEEALTPFHFLLGSSSGRPIPATLSEREVLSREGWRRAVKLADHFWCRWVREYLPTLTPRRGGGVEPRLKEGDLVIVADERLPRGSWPRGRITRLYPGPDGVVRVADILTAAGLLKRPIKRLVLL